MIRIKEHKNTTSHHPSRLKKPGFASSHYHFGWGSVESVIFLQIIVKRDNDWGFCWCAVKLEPRSSKLNQQNALCKTDFHECLKKGSNVRHFMRSSFFHSFQSKNKKFLLQKQGVEGRGSSTTQYVMCKVAHLLLIFL